MSLRRFDLHVPISDDGRTTFAEVADVLDHLATVYAWHSDAHGFLLARACEARQIDRTYSEADEHKSVTMKEVWEHMRDNPVGCPAPACDVCRPRRKK